MLLSPGASLSAGAAAHWTTPFAFWRSFKSLPSSSFRAPASASLEVEHDLAKAGVNDEKDISHFDSIRGQQVMQIIPVEVLVFVSVELQAGSLIFVIRRAMP